MQDLVDQIMEVMDKAFDPTWGEAWNRRQVSDSLILSNTYTIIIDENGSIGVPANKARPAGFCLSRHAPGEEELLLIAVKPSCRETGLGRKLIAQLILDARSREVLSIFLEMRANNPAENLYRRIGFEPIGKRPQYYRLTNGDRMDAITFAYRIS